MSSPQPPLPATHHSNADSSHPSRPLSLDDLPAEVIEEIVEYILIQECNVITFCGCDSSRLRPLNLPNATRRDFSGSTWIFSCVSKRYRDIVFHGHAKRHLDLENYSCCIDKVLTMPDHIRLSITYALENSDQLCCPSS